MAQSFLLFAVPKVLVCYYVELAPWPLVHSLGEVRPSHSDLAEVQRFVEENTEVRLEALDTIGKSHARRNLLSVLVDADITLDSNLRICSSAWEAAPKSLLVHVISAILVGGSTRLHGVYSKV